MAGKPKHGLSQTPEYRAWQQMLRRCTQPGHPAWKDYGGRGIKVCDRWASSVVDFIADMGPRPSSKHELDRRDNNGDYTPDNCRWVLRYENCRNRRSNRILSLSGESLTVAAWSERLGIPSDVILKRLQAGWAATAALQTPVRPKSPAGLQKEIRTPCIDCGRLALGARCRPCENKNRALIHGRRAA